VGKVLLLLAGKGRDSYAYPRCLIVSHGVAKKPPLVGGFSLLRFSKSLRRKDLQIGKAVLAVMPFVLFRFGSLKENIDSEF